mmetsp:Transcript_2504/g.9916  ORF Transcript_2504/g.9916 Transcript_2504/m.9916 type:complete len:205 (-) Transcript_2504:675-1289(-)
MGRGRGRAEMSSAEVGGGRLGVSPRGRRAWRVCLRPTTSVVGMPAKAKAARVLRGHGVGAEVGVRGHRIRLVLHPDRHACLRVPAVHVSPGGHAHRVHHALVRVVRLRCGGGPGPPAGGSVTRSCSDITAGTRRSGGLRVLALWLAAARLGLRGRPSRVHCGRKSCRQPAGVGKLRGEVSWGGRKSAASQPCSGERPSADRTRR